MTIPASITYQNTVAALTAQDAQILSDEVTLAEKFIAAAVTKGLFNLSFNSTLIGNPQQNPANTSALTALQQSFYNALINAGYTVGIDPASGYWSISWLGYGVEAATAVYSLRTTLTPGAVSAATITTVNNYFKTRVPVVTCRTQLLSLGNGGVMDETAFGASLSTYYEYTIITGQPSVSTDHTAPLKAYLVAQNIGYTTNNCGVYRIG